MKQMFRIGSVILLTAAVAVACGKQSTSPVSPSGVEQAGSDATAPGGLKATAPTPVSPTNGVKPTGALVLVANRSTMPFSPVALPLSYQFEILTPAGAVIYVSPLIDGGSGATVSHTPTASLTVDQTYHWRIRATYEGANGPYSANATFIANRPGAFINATTLWDPLDNPNDGFAARRIVGAHTWIPGVGLRMDDATSHVAYELPDGGRIEEGELSAIISNTPHNTEYTKTKVLSMTGGYADATTNYARMSLEKRGDAPTGGIAWRFLTTDGEGAETIGGERDIRNFDFDDGPHFWQATWRHNHFGVLIQKGGPGGPELYNFGKHYSGFYNPVPHVIWIGFGPNRSGPDSSTVPGMIIRALWASWDPRPAYANQ
jgi:hypothetical protein